MWIQLPGFYSQQTGSTTIDPGDAKVFQFPIFAPVCVRNQYINETRLFNAEIVDNFTIAGDVQPISSNNNTGKLFNAYEINDSQYVQEFYDAIPLYNTPFPASGTTVLGPVGFISIEDILETEGSLPPSFILPIPNDIEPGIPICNTFVTSLQRELWEDLLESGIHFTMSFFDTTGEAQPITSLLDDTYAIELAIPLFKIYKLILEDTIGIPHFSMNSGYTAMNANTLTSSFISIEI